MLKIVFNFLYKIFWIILLLSFCTSSSLTIYDNANFQPNDNHFILDMLSQVNTSFACACICFNNSMCLTATYLGINQSCILFSARLEQGTLKIMFTNEIASVLTFKNKTLSDPSQLTYINETVYGVWNTVAGGDSHSLSPVIGQEPEKAFDSNSTTVYSTSGGCVNSSSPVQSVCSANTGLYLSLQQGPSLLVAFQFCTANSNPPNDPVFITIEGSNQAMSILNLGSSWTLIYNGASGLNSNPGRHTYGVIQSVLDNSIWYTSYRILITSTRANANFVQFSELKLLGYY